MNKQLQNKLKTYSALTAVAGLAASSVEAQIIHTCINYTGGYESYNIDIDGDGTNDVEFRIDAFTSTYGVGCVPYGGWVRGNGLGSVGNAFFYAYGNGGFNVPSALTLGAASSGWYGQLYGNANYVFPCNTSYAGSFGYLGTLSGSNTKLIGVRFDISGNTHYGWMRINIDFDPTTRVLNSWTLIDMAYESTPDASINAADFVPVDSGVTQVGNTLTSDEATGGTTYQWVDCDNGNAPIGGETNQNFTPSASGNYAVELTLNGCTVTSSCTSVTVLGISENRKQITKLHPNPASDIIMIDLAELHSNTTMTIVDVTGKVVKESVVTTKRNTINLTEFAQGVYFVKITSEQVTNTVKFVKK